MGRGGRGRGRGSVGGDHPEDEEDFYEEEMDVRLSPARGRGERGWWAQPLLEAVPETAGKKALDGRFLSVFPNVPLLFE